MFLKKYLWKLWDSVQDKIDNEDYKWWNKWFSSIIKAHWIDIKEYKTSFIKLKDKFKKDPSQHDVFRSIINDRIKWEKRFWNLAFYYSSLSDILCKEWKYKQALEMNELYDNMLRKQHEADKKEYRKVLWKDNCHEYEPTPSYLEKRKHILDKIKEG